MTRRGVWRCQVLFLKLKKNVEKAGDGDVNSNGNPAMLLRFPVEITVRDRGTLYLSYFNGFTHCNSVAHTDKISSMNHIRYEEDGSLSMLYAPLI